MKLALLISFSFASLVAASNPSAASDVAKELRACAAQLDDTARLACFDKLAAGISEHPISPPKMERQPPAVSAEESFGVGAGQFKKADTPAPVNRITSKVVKIEERSRGRIVVTLENDQVWEQVTADSLFSLRPGDVITIKSAALGSFLLVAPSNRFTNVSRIR